MLSRLKKERRSRREAPLPRKPFCLVPEMRPAVQKVVQILPALLRGSPPSCSGPAHCAIAARIQGNLVARVEWLKTGVGTGFTGVCVCVCRQQSVYSLSSYGNGAVSTAPRGSPVFPASATLGGGGGVHLLTLSLLRSVPYALPCPEATPITSPTTSQLTSHLNTGRPEI